MNFFNQSTTHRSRHTPTIDEAQQYQYVCITLSNNNHIYLKLIIIVI